MDTTSAALSPFSVFSSGVLAASTLDAVDIHSKNPGYMMEQVVETGKGREDSDTAMDTSCSQTPNNARSESAPNNAAPSAQPSASNQPSTSAVPFPKSATSNFSSNLIPPTPPTMSNANPSPSTGPTPGSSPKSSPRMTRPQLTSRLSSRVGGKRHASIGSQREMPFVLPASGSTTISSDPLTPSLSPAHTPHATNDTATSTSSGLSARLREMGRHISSMGPATPKSGSSGPTSPRSPDEHRSYFNFRRKTSSGNAVSPGRIRSAAATPPPPPPPPPPAPVKKDSEMKQSVSPISEESNPSNSSSSYSKPRRANLSLDLGTTLAQRGSTASLPLIGHTPVQHLVQKDPEPKPRRASMMVPPAAPPPHVHTPPVHPPSYEYPFLPNHAPRQPLEIHVEEVGPGVNSGDVGSWVISVRLPGFHPDGITIGTRRGRVLVIVADNWDDNDGAGHFERRISFGYDADMAAIRAEFNGDLLRVTVPRRSIFGPIPVGMRSTVGGGPVAGRPMVQEPGATSAV